MAKHRVQQWGKPNGFVTVETDATVGAVLGVNVFWPDGSLVEYAQLELYPPGTPEAEANGQPPKGYEPAPGESPREGGGTSDNSLVYWRTIMEIPANVSGIAGLSGTGIVRRTGDSTFDLSSTTSDLPEGSNLYYTDSRVYGSAKAMLKAGSNVTITPNDGLLTLTISASGGGGPGGDGVVLSMIAATTIHGGRAVSSDPDEVYHPALAVPIDGPRVVGIAMQSVSTGDPVDIRTSGPITDPAWSWTGGPVYVGDAGVLTQTAPTSGWIVSVGSAISSNTIDVNVKITLLRG